MVICEKCKKLCNCKDGEIFLSLKKSIHLRVPECGNFEEKEEEKVVNYVGTNEEGEKYTYDAKKTLYPRCDSSSCSIRANWAPPVRR